MTAETTDPKLRRNSLGLPELVFQGVTHIAPATNMVFTFPIIALKAGPDMPLSFLLATIACFFIGSTVAEFSRFMPSSGGYYSFVTRGLGNRAGFLATVSYLAYDVLGSAATPGSSATSRTFLIAEFNVNIPWWILALCAFAIWTLTLRGVRISENHHDPGRSRAPDHARPGDHLPGPPRRALVVHRPARHQWHPAVSGVIAGMVFSILALSGFEAPAPLAQEANRPAPSSAAPSCSRCSSSASSTSSWPTRRRSAGARATCPPSPPTQIRTTLLAMRCGELGGGSWCSL